MSEDIVIEPCETFRQATVTAPIITGAAKHRVWRVPIHGHELIAAGWQPNMDANTAWDTIIKPMLIKKGLPEGFGLERTPCRMSPTETGVMLEFV